MKMLLTNKPPCRLEKGNLRRVPQNPVSNIVAYQVCCPRCGFTSLAFQGRDGLFISEAEEGSEMLVTFSEPVRCIFCNVLIHLKNNQGRIEENNLV